MAREVDYPAVSHFLAWPPRSRRRALSGPVDVRLTSGAKARLRYEALEPVSQKRVNAGEVVEAFGFFVPVEGSDGGLPATLRVLEPSASDRPLEGIAAMRRRFALEKEVVSLEEDQSEAVSRLSIVPADAPFAFGDLYLYHRPSRSLVKVSHDVARSPTEVADAVWRALSIELRS